MVKVKTNDAKVCAIYGESFIKILNGKKNSTPKAFSHTQLGCIHIPYVDLPCTMGTGLPRATEPWEHSRLSLNYTIAPLDKDGDKKYRTKIIADSNST